LTQDELRGERGEEEIQELEEESGQQFLEKPVVVYSGHAADRRRTVHRFQVNSEGIAELGASRHRPNLS